MNIFPTITNLDEFKANVGDIPGIEFKTNEDGYTVASYYILDSKVFDNPYARECRGITFDKNGKLVSRPFHKFFNLGEKEATLEQNLDWNNVATVMDKRDGCCDGDVEITTLHGKKTIRDICETKYLGPILGFNHTTNQIETSYIVNHSIIENNNDWYEITIEDGTTIKLTGNHLVWANNMYVAVRDLIVGDNVCPLSDLT